MSFQSEIDASIPPLDEPVAGFAAVGDPATDRPRSRPSQRVNVVTANNRVWPRVARMWRERDLLAQMVGREMKVRYKNSVLGFAWSMLNPTLQLVVYVLVFQGIMGNGIPDFAIFLLCGLVVWNFFTSAVAGATGAIVGNGDLIKKVSFSREILAVAAIGSSSIFFLIQSGILIAALVLFGFSPQWHYLPLLVPAIIALALFTAALAIFLSAANVYLRDTQHLLEVVLMAWFWATPIVYSYNGFVVPKLPVKVDKNGHLISTSFLVKYHLTWLPMKEIYLANPITPIVLTFQRALWGNKRAKASSGSASKIHAVAGAWQLPLFGPMWYFDLLLGVIGISTILLFAAIKVFGRLEGNFAEEF